MSFLVKINRSSIDLIEEVSELVSVFDIEFRSFSYVLILISEHIFYL